MKPEQLIAEVEALDKSATHGPWIAGELGTGDAGVIRDSYQDYIGEADGNRWQENTQLIARFRTLAPELAQHCKELRAALERLTTERDEARAELAKAGESIRAYERMIDGVAEKASALACEQVKAEFLRRDTLARLQAAEIEALKSELARLTTPRPIEEAPKDGTWIVGLWPDVLRLTPEFLRWAGSHGWERNDEDGHYKPTHFLPLPVKP